ncbi:hypothetical protein [Caballeronia grimmiae]|uniref:hypothetical protein n=1 Tax=Caballeronia grimmiae TaxID=1071679 RepID=UPI0038BB2588
MGTVQVLRQTHVTPPPALAEAISSELFERVKMREIPVLLMRQQAATKQWGGFCMPSSYTESDEIVLDARCVERGTWDPQPDAIKVIYLHEAAHRLLPTMDHNGAFLAMALVLYLRAGTDSPLWHRVKLYDVQDEGENAPLAFSWAWKVAHELAASELSAERCAEVIVTRYQEWCTWLAGADERVQARRDAAEAIEQQIKSLKESRWWCALTGFAVGAVVVAAVAVWL